MATLNNKKKQPILTLIIILRLSCVYRPIVIISIFLWHFCIAIKACVAISKLYAKLKKSIRWPKHSRDGGRCWHTDHHLDCTLWRDCIMTMSYSAYHQSFLAFAVVGTAKFDSIGCLNNMIVNVVVS